MTNRGNDYFEWNDKNEVQLLECLYCKHWYRYKGSKCEAFPQGIPMDILLIDTKHRKPYNGDGGIQFKPIEK